MRRVLWLVCLLGVGGFLVWLGRGGDAAVERVEGVSLVGMAGLPSAGAVVVTPIPLTFGPPSSSPSESQDSRGVRGVGRSTLPTAGNRCEGAPQATFSFPSDLLAGGQTDVSAYTTDADDPPLSCLAGSGFDQRGYRSAWYKVVPPVTGNMRVRTISSVDYKFNYDTVIAVHAGGNGCGSLVELTCNDDAYALLSEVSLRVVEGQTYFIEVVARDPSSGSLPPRFNLEVTLDAGSEWAAETLLPRPLTAHTVVVSGTTAYVLGGITTIFPNFGSGGDRTNAFWAFDTETETFTGLPPMPAALAPGGGGYAYADGVIVRGELHMPSGFVGTNGSYDGTHWVYNFADATWRVSEVTPPWGAPPGTNVPGWTALADHELGLQRGFFVTGGLRGPVFGGEDAAPSSDFYQYLDTGGATPQWLTLPSMSKGRYAHTAVRVGSDICVVGGLTTIEVNGNIVNGLDDSGECYKPGGVAPTFEPGWFNNVGALNVPRYMADSFIGPDGRWYVVGGVSATGSYVGVVEVHNFATAKWEIVDVSYSVNNPALAWVRGGFVGNRLWLFGGQQPGGPVPVPLVQSRRFPSVLANTAYLPLVAHAPEIGRALGFPYELVFDAPVIRRFERTGEVYHVYRLVVPTAGQVVLTMDHIPENYDYDLLLYGANKDLIDLSDNVGNTHERIVRVLGAGVYYVMVANTTPNIDLAPSGYRLWVSRNG